MVDLITFADYIISIEVDKIQNYGIEFFNGHSIRLGVVKKRYFLWK